MTPKSGTSGRTANPASFCSAALHAALPARSAAENVAGKWRSRAGFHSSMSMPFRIPIRSELRDDRTPSSPLPYADVWISRAYVGLTVDSSVLW